MLFISLSLGISSHDKRLVRVGAKTFAQTGTYITIKLYKKDEEGTFKYRQGITLSTGAFESLAENYTKIKRLTKAKYCDVTEKLRKSGTNLKNLHAPKRNAKVKTMLTVCNIRPEDTYRRKTKLSLKTTG